MYNDRRIFREIHRTAIVPSFKPVEVERIEEDIIDEVVFDNVRRTVQVPDVDWVPESEMRPRLAPIPVVHHTPWGVRTVLEPRVVNDVITRPRPVPVYRPVDRVEVIPRRVPVSYPVRTVRTEMVPSPRRITVEGHQEIEYQPVFGDVRIDAVYDADRPWDPVSPGEASYATRLFLDRQAVHENNHENNAIELEEDFSPSYPPQQTLVEPPESDRAEHFESSSRVLTGAPLGAILSNAPSGGVVLSSIEIDGPLDVAGCIAGDIIKQADMRRVYRKGDLRLAMKQKRRGEPLRLVVEVRQVLE